MVPLAPHDRKSALRRRMRDAEDELARAQVEYCALAGGEAMPGLHVVVGAAGYRAMLPAWPVREIIRLVAFDPIPEAPPHVAGAFVYRGTPVLALDLAASLGVSREPSLDAHILVLQGSRDVGLVVDRVETLTESPILVGEASGEDSDDEAWRRTGLAVGLCRLGNSILPILGLGPIQRLAERRA